MLVNDTMKPGFKVYYHEPTSKEVAHRYLAKLLELNICGSLGEAQGYGGRPAILVAVEEPHHLGALELLVEGPHSGEIVNEYTEELTAYGIDSDKIIQNHYASGTILADAGVTEKQAEEEYDKLFKLSCELMLRSFIELLYAESAQLNSRK